MDSSPSPNGVNLPTNVEQSGSPKKSKVEERKVWLEDYFVKKPKYTFQKCREKCEGVIGEFYKKNPSLNSSMPKETLVDILEKLAFNKVFLEPDDNTKAVLQRTAILKFSDDDFKLLEGFDHYFATCFIVKNITDHCQEILLQNIFKPENCDVKYFINEIAMQNADSPLYAMWDKVIYSKLFPTTKTDTPITRIQIDNPSDSEISAAIQTASDAITGPRTRPKNTLSNVKDYLDLCKKHNRLDLKSYESILSLLLYKLVIADLLMSSELSHEKLLRYSTFYKGLLLKLVYFNGQTEWTSQEKVIVSNVKSLIKEVKLNIDEIFLCPERGMDWLERSGVYLASFLEHLTEKMVNKYMAEFHSLPYGGGTKSIYTERIFTYFIKPILNSTAAEGIPAIDQDNFFNLFVPVTQYMYDTKECGRILTENEWKGLRIWLENSEYNANLVRSVCDKYYGDSSQTTNFTGVSMEIG